MARSISSISSLSSSTGYSSAASSPAAVATPKSEVEQTRMECTKGKGIKLTATKLTIKSGAVDKRKRLAANARERKRMHLLNEAYDKLRKRLADAENKSKYDVLVQAKEYIQALATICAKFDEQNPTHPSVARSSGEKCAAGPREAPSAATPTTSYQSETRDAETPRSSCSPALASDELQQQQIAASFTSHQLLLYYTQHQQQQRQFHQSHYRNPHDFSRFQIH